MIKIEKLVKTYGDIAAVDNINLTFREGIITGLLGPNGAGKTTLVSILSCIVKKSAGRVTINGLDLDSNPDRIRSISCIVPQSLAFYPLLSVQENLEYYGVLYGLQGTKLRERIDFSVEVASLQSFLNKRAAKCSGGIQRRLNLAIGLLNEPEILYLDEPTVGVDAQSRRYILEMIRKINRDRKTTIVYTSHYISEIEQISDDIVIIDHGDIVLSGSMDEILSARDNLAIDVGPENSRALDHLKDVQGIMYDQGAILIRRDGMLYQNLIQVITLLRDSGIEMKSMQYNTHRLEELYLHMTSRHLRDAE